LQGYIPDENIMFRKEGIKFHEKPPATSTSGYEPLLKWERIEKTLGGFKLVTEPGADVLTIWGGLLDVVSFVPPEPMGRGDIYLRSIGEATLVLEIRDSESNATLVRVLDRRVADSGQTFQMSNTVTNWSEVQHVARTWATTLRVRLDEAADWAR
jgi:hypothetical protein